MEWKTVKLGDVCDLIAGFAFKAGDFGDYPQKVVKIGDINPPHVTYASMSGIDLSKYDVKKLEKFKVQYGDYVLAMTGATIGKVGKYIDSAFSYLNQRVLMFKPKPEVDAQFVNYVVCSAYFRQYVMNHIDSESAQPNISATTIGKYEFPLPPLETQRRIAAILSSLDDQIENNNRINANLEAQAQAIFKSWFVDFEPWGGIMPEDWREGCLDEIIEEMPKSKIQVGAAKDIKGLYPFFTSGSSVLEYNEALVSGRNIFLNTGGVAGVVFYVGAAAYSTDTWCVRGRDGLSDYLYLYLSSMVDILNAEYFEGSALKHLQKKNLKQRSIIIPSNKAIKEFNKLVYPMFDTIMANQEENKRLATLRDTLLPKLMKGEISL